MELLEIFATFLGILIYPGGFQLKLLINMTVILLFIFSYFN